MYRSQLDQVLKNTDGFADRASRILSLARLHSSERQTGAAPAIDTLEGLHEGVPGAAFELARELVPEELGRHGLAEAIVLAELRPAFFVVDDGIDLHNAGECDEILLNKVETDKTRFADLCKGVGRVDLSNHFTLPFAGTGFLIDETLVVTNRHVALVFAERLRSGYRARKGRFGVDIEARVDYRRHLGSTARLRVDVLEVLYIARDDEPDFALLRVERQIEARPLMLLGGRDTRIRPGMPVAIVGYPAADGDRNDRALMDRVFKGQYEVKRFAPGFLTELSEDNVVLMADYSSLGGNSGSPVIGLDDGEVLGLHFAGRFMENNYAVAADVIEAARMQIMRSVSVPSSFEESPTTKPEKLSGRNGYDPEFLGDGDLRVPFPKLGDWRDDVAPVQDSEDGVLNYRNFSVIQSVSRRLPLVTAVNIDGERAVVLKRKGDWKLDGRLKVEHQIDNVLYETNALDRGHLVRRRDPGWGPDAQQAEIDTFHYTNSVPQHEDLNQKDWVGLEDYVLEAAETQGFKASVFTGPVFRDSDRCLKAQPGADDVPIPEEFWKVVVMVNVSTGRLSATGYVLSHGPMIRDLVESPFVYGRYKTYQVKIALIAAKTGLDFGALTDADPLGATLPAESRFAQVARVVEGAASLVLQ